MDATARPRKRVVVARARQVVDALEHLVGGMGTAILAAFALLVMVVVALSCLVGIGFLIAPVALKGLRKVADRERVRLSRSGSQVVGPHPLPDRLSAMVRDSAVGKELAWAASHGTLGLFLSALGLTLPVAGVRDTLFPLYWRLVPEDQATGQFVLWVARDWPSAIAVAVLGLVWFALAAVALPWMAFLQSWIGRRLLSPDAGTDLALRVTQLTATRAAALDAHTAELRRIERSLHDGTQNRLVAVNVMLGAARRALVRNPSDADAMLGRAQDATEQALAELRAVVRSILPPVLADRSLSDALSALASTCPIPCLIDANVPGRCAASVEATAYFVVAETLTNITKHSNAQHATVTLDRHGDQLHLKVTDDGRGGADERNGSGLGGIRRRVEAFDGTFALTSPPGGPTALTVSLPCGL
jgi:signal transduction histidine kinase